MGRADRASDSASILAPRTAGTGSGGADPAAAELSPEAGLPASADSRAAGTDLQIMSIWCVLDVNLPRFLAQNREFGEEIYTWTAV